MTYEEFKIECAPYGAYFDWISVKEAKESGKIPEKYHDYFDDFCVCGSENVIKENLTQEMCCDPCCSVKVGYKLAEMLSRFGIKGLGNESCAKVYQAFCKLDKQLKDRGERGIFYYNSYVELLMVSWENYPFELKEKEFGNNFFCATQRIKEQVITFPELIKNLGLTAIGGKSTDLFAGINSFEELKNEIKNKGSIRMFCISRGFYAPAIAFNLKKALPDIFVASYIFQSSIRNLGLKDLPVCMTGSIRLHGQSITKAAFINACNELCRDDDGVQIFEVKLNKAVESNNFILYSTASGSAQFEVGRRRGTVTDEFGTHDVLMTADDFYSLLEGVISEWKKKQKSTVDKQEMKTLTSF